MRKQKKAWFEIGWFDIPVSIGRMWAYVLLAAVIGLGVSMLVGCSPTPSCTEKEMAEWRAKNPKAGSAEASYRYRRFQQECGESDG